MLTDVLTFVLQKKSSEEKSQFLNSFAFGNAAQELNKL